MRQATALSNTSLRVRWDVALDMWAVRYRLYYSAGAAFNFTADPDLRTSTVIDLVPIIPAAYAQGQPEAFPYEAVVDGLTPGQTYFLCIRAYEVTPLRLEERNERVLNVTLPL